MACLSKSIVSLTAGQFRFKRTLFTKTTNPENTKTDDLSMFVHPLRESRMFRLVQVYQERR